VPLILTAAGATVGIIVVVVSVSRPTPTLQQPTANPPPRSGSARGDVSLPPTSSIGRQDPLSTTAAGGPLRVGGNIKAPRKIFDVKPQYPDEARATHAKGIVILEVTIANDGSVSDAQVLRSTPMFDQAAIDAVKRWRFQPTLLNGMPIEVTFNVMVNFVPSSE